MTAVLVCSAGGHLEEMRLLAEHSADIDQDRLWAVPETPQTRSMLVGEDVVWIDPVAPRQLGRALASLPLALRILRGVRPRMLVSTGAAIAAPYLVAARMCHIEAHFVDSATRFAGPSMTGRIASHIPGTVLHCQSPTWADPRWHHLGSLFDAYETQPVVPRRPRRAVVTLGGERFAFPRAVRAAQRLLAGGDWEVVWQLGGTFDHVEQPGAQRLLEHHVLMDELTRADLVISHAGVGSVLSAFAAGHLPVVLAREGRYGEHVDDHQRDLADALVARGLAVGGSPEGVDARDVDRALRHRVVHRAGASFDPRLAAPVLPTAASPDLVGHA